MNTEHVLLEGGKKWKQREWKHPGWTFIVSLVEDDGFKDCLYQTHTYEGAILAAEEASKDCGIPVHDTVVTE